MARHLCCEHAQPPAVLKHALEGAGTYSSCGHRSWDRAIGDKSEIETVGIEFRALKRGYG